MSRRLLAASALVAFGQQREQHVHLGALLLHVADVVEAQAIEAVQAPQLAGQAQVALGGQQPLDERLHGREEHQGALAHQFVADRGHRVRLAHAGITATALRFT